MRSSPPWPVVSELKKQYEVVQVSPSSELPEDLDALVVALPSSLSQPEMDELLDKVKSGVPALFLVDPLPVVNVGLAPSEQPGANQNPFMRNQAPPPKPKGDIQQFLAQLGVSWDSSRIVWDSYNPHPDLAHLPPEVVFVGEGNGNSEAFDKESRVTSELQEIVLLYPGSVDKAVDSNYEMRSLLMTGNMSGRFSYFQMISRSFFGVQLNRNLPHRPDEYEYPLAVHVTGPGASSTLEDSEGDASEDEADTPNEEEESSEKEVER